MNQSNYRRRNRRVMKLSQDYKKPPNSNFIYGEKPATEDQLQTIETFQKMVEQNYKEFGTSLNKSVKQAERLKEISSSTGIYQPMLAQNITQEISFNPSSASSEQISRWLEKPQYYESNIRALSQFLEINVGQYHRVMWYYNTIKSFNYQLLPIDGSIKKDLKQKKEQVLNSMDTALKQLSKMDVKNNFPKMDLATLQDGASFWWINEYNDIYDFIRLPTEYCYITGSWTNGWTGCIDLTYFDKMRGLEDAMPELSEAYQTFLRERDGKSEGRKLSPFQYYPLPLDKSWIFTCDPNRALKTNNLTNAMGASLDVMSYRQLLKDQSLFELWKLLAFEIPKDKNNKLLMTYDFASDIVEAIQTVLPENVVGFATPFKVEPVSMNQITSIDKLIGMGNDNVMDAFGVQGNLFGKENKSAKGFTYGIQIDFAYASTHMYMQFNKMVNWFLSLKSKTYRWGVRFEGNILERDVEIDRALKLMTTANFPVSNLVAKVGYEPHEFYNLVDIENALDLKNTLKPILSPFQQGSNSGSSTTKETGRPSKGNQVEDAGEKSREYEFSEYEKNERLEKMNYIMENFEDIKDMLESREV